MTRLERLARLRVRSAKTQEARRAVDEARLQAQRAHVSGLVKLYSPSEGMVSGDALVASASFAERLGITQMLLEERATSLRHGLASATREVRRTERLQEKVDASVAAEADQRRRRRAIHQKRSEAW